MTYDPTWIRKSPILIPQAIHNEALTAQKGSVRLDALDWGQKVGATTLDNSKGTSAAVSLSPLNNGKMFVTWGAGTEGRYAIVNSSGNMDSTAYQTFEASNFLDYQYGLATVLLPNGNVAVAYGQDQGANNALVLKIYSEAGDVVRDAVTVKTHATETQWGVGLAALPDGSIVITWQEVAAGSMSYFAIYDMDGDLVKGYTSLGGNYGIPQPAPLSDGNWIVTYENSGVRFRTYDRLGIQVVGETLFRSGVTQATGIVTMGNGQIVVPFTRGFGILDRQGNVVVSPQILEGSGQYSISVLPHDNIVAQNNDGTAAKYKIYDSEGNLLNSEVTYDTAAEAIAGGDVATFKNGNFMLAYVTASGENDLKIFIHEGTKAGFAGDLSISGEFSLATGTTVNEISTDGTLADDSDDSLVTEKAIKTYADNIVSSSAYRIFDGDSQVAVYDDSTGTSKIDVTIDNTFIARFNSDGLTLDSGVAVSTINNDIEMGGYNGATGSQTALTTEYAARKYLDDILDSQNEPTGFADGNSDSVTTIGIDGSNTFYIEPVGASYDVFFSGQRWEKTSREEVAISDVEGMHYIYFDPADGVLKETTIFSIDVLYTQGYVAAIYWNATDKEVVYLGDERHGCTMDGKTHANIHVARGTLYNSGLALSDITADSTSAVDIDAQFSISNGVITDEDISHVISSRAFPANIAMFYLDGFANWRKSTPDDYPVMNAGTGRVAWNRDLGGSWSLTEATDGYFVMTHIFATNDKQGNHIIGIVGQAEYSTITSARAAAAQEINDLVHGSMPFEEYHPVATLIFETSDSFGNTPKAIIRSNENGADWTDWRTSGLSPGTGSVTSHSSLSDLANDDHLQYFRVDGLRAVTGNLTVNGTSTLESAVTAEAGISMTGGSLSLVTGASVNEFSTDGTLADDSDTAIPTEQAVKTYVDAAVSGLDQTKIYEGDSYVQVVDDGTNTSYVEVVVDGVQVQYWDAEASSIRLGKASSAGRITLSDSEIEAYVGTEQKLTLTSTTARLGEDGDCSFQLYDSGLTQTATLELGGNDFMYFTAASYGYFGPSGDQLYVDFATHETKIDVNSVEVLNLQETTQVLGVSGDTRLVLDQAGDQVDLYAGATNILSATGTTQRFGASGDTALTLNTTADTFTLSAGANTQISGALTQLSLGVAGDTTIVLDQSTDSVTMTAGGQSQLMIETSGTTVYDDLTVTGDLFVDGTTFVVNETHVRTADNLITVNYGEPGAGVTAGTAGIEVDRGTLANYYFVFAENTDTFRIGEDGDTQAVATREDSPIDMAIPYWNDALKRFDTSGDTYIIVDQTAGSYNITTDSVEALTIDENGIQLFTTGAIINEFSTDGTLAGNSDTALPTEQAVKTYVDNAITNIATDKISEGDSYVEVIDDGTNTGYVTVVTDGVEVANFDAESSSVRIGKASGNSRLVIADASAEIYAGSQAQAAALISEQFSAIGTADGAAFSTYSSFGTTTVQIGVDTEIVGIFTPFASAIGDVLNSFNGPRIVAETDAAQQCICYADTGTYTLIDNGAGAEDYGAFQVIINNATKMWIQENTQVLGQQYGSGFTYVTTTQDNGSITLTANTAEVLRVNGSGLQLFGSGAIVNEFSTDGTLAGNSDIALPTEQAVKTYADAGDATTLVSAQAYADSGDASTLSSAQTYADAGDATTLVSAQAYADSGDTSTLSSANSYTDTQINILRSEVDLINMTTVSSDTTAVTGDVLLVDTTANDVTIEMQVGVDSRIIVKKKTTDGNKVNITTSNGTIDGQNLIIIDTPYQSFTFVSDGSNFYII